MTTTTPPVAASEPWRSKQFVAAHYGVHLRTVERWLYAGCPSRLVGPHRRFRLSDVETFLTLTQEN